MDTHAIQPEVTELIARKDFAALKGILGSLEAPDVADLAGDLEGEELGVVFRLLPPAKAGEVFGWLDLDRQERLLEVVSGPALAGILNEMPPDDRTELFEDLPDDVTGRLLRSLSRDERKVALDLLGYPEDSIGRLMTPEFVAVQANWTMQQVLDHLRTVAPQKETLNVLYVVDEAGKLVDELTLEELVLADPRQRVGEVIDRQPVFLLAAEDREEAVEIFRKHEAVALPVLDAAGVLVGIVTVDDVMDVQEEETTEDFHKMVAVAALEEPYFATTWPEMMRKRLPWLVLLFAAELLTVMALTGFERSLQATMFALIVLFMPLINATAGNAGAQMAGLVIRGLAVHEMDPRDWGRILWREMLLGGSLALPLGVLGVAASLLMLRAGPDRPDLTATMLGNALGVGVSIAAAVIAANIIGAMVPLMFKRLGLDPAVTSGPFLASVMDVTGVLIYFSIAAAIMGLLAG